MSTTPKKRSLLRRALRLLILAALAWYGTLYVTQHRVLFPAHLTRPLAESSIPADVERLWLDTPDATRTEAWLLQPRSAAAASASIDATRHPLVVFFHGNGELIDDQFTEADHWRRRGFAVLLPEYRGYGRSTGSPSQAAITSDAIELVRRVQQRPDIDAARTLFVGRSIGGGVALSVAPTIRPAGVITISTFTSITSMARRYGAPGFLVRSPFRNDAALAAISAPVLLLHGVDDTLIPVTHARALAAVARPAGSTTTLIEQPGDHNDFPRDPAAFWAAIERWRAEHGL
jgi:uncharacterized protein